MDPLLGQIAQAILGVLITGIAVGLTTVYFKVKELHAWHDKEDDDGVKVWYARNKSTEETLSRMVDILDRLDRREERAMLIQNENIKVMQEHTVAITKLVSVVEALIVFTQKERK